MDAGTGARSAQLSAPVLLPDTTLIVGGGIPHRTFRIAAESHDIFITVLPCGRRIYSVFTFGDGALELLRRMMTSLRCNADTHAVPPVPAIVDLPDGWKPTDAEPGQLAYRRDSEVLVVVALDILSEGMLQGAMESTVRQIGANARLDSRREITTPNGIRTVWIGAVAGGDTTVPIHLSALTCREQRVTLGIMHIGGIDETRSVELFGRVRCADTPPAGPAAK